MKNKLNMKKHELIKYAYDNYPKGTKFIGASDYAGKIQESTGDLRFSDNYFGIINYPNGKGIIYDGDKNAWAEIVKPKISDKIPLLISMDGIELCEGDTYWPVYFHGNDTWAIEHSKETCLEFNHSCLVQPNKCKAFKDKQKALDWIEAQKPKEIEVDLYFGSKAKVKDKDSEIFFYQGGDYHFKLSFGDIKDIYEKIKDI